jgi:hypothetical protein
LEIVGLLHIFDDSSAVSSQIYSYIRALGFSIQLLFLFEQILIEICLSSHFILCNDVFKKIIFIEKFVNCLTEIWLTVDILYIFALLCKSIQKFTFFDHCKHLGPSFYYFSFVMSFRWIIIADYFYLTKGFVPFPFNKINTFILFSKFRDMILL